MIPLRNPKSAGEAAHAERCECRVGVIATKNGQDTVRCASCDTYLYCAPRVETGRAVRSVSTVHAGITSKTRYKVLERASGRCEVCGGRKDLHVGHILSVADGVAQGLKEDKLNSLENLAAVCAECNLGAGRQSMPLWLATAILNSRTNHA